MREKINNLDMVANIVITKADKLPSDPCYFERNVHHDKNYGHLDYDHSIKENFFQDKVVLDIFNIKVINSDLELVCKSLTYFFTLSSSRNELRFISPPYCG